MLNPRLLFYLVVLLWSALPSGCASPFPTSRGLTIKRPPTADSPGFRNTLQIKWLGTASYSIQLGDVALLTDPFFTRHPMLKVEFGTVASDPATVLETIEGLPIPQAVFVGHSHYDHMLDLAASLSQPGWCQVPVYGSETTRNILFGYDRRLAEKNWQPVQKDGEWHTVAPGLAYQAVPAEHAPNLTCGHTGLLYSPGAVPEPLAQAPRKAAEFKVGETFAFVFRLSNEHVEPSSCRQRTFTVYFAGSATSAPRGFPDASVEAVDVAILCVPGWKNVMGYPGRFLERLRPRVVVLSHFDDMFQERGVIRKTVPTAAFDEFLVEVQRFTDYKEFERIVAPDVGETVLIRKP